MRLFMDLLKSIYRVAAWVPTTIYEIMLWNEFGLFILFNPFIGENGQLK